MSMYGTTIIRNRNDGLGLSSQSNSSQSSRLKHHMKSEMPECENNSLFKSLSKIKEINKTYVISACKKVQDEPLTPNLEGRLALQRRTRKIQEPPLLGSQLQEETEETTEQLTLQRRIRLDSLEKCKTNKNAPDIIDNKKSALDQSNKNLKTANSDKHSFVKSISPVFENIERRKTTADEKSKEKCSVPNAENGNILHDKCSVSQVFESQSQNEVSRLGHSTVMKPIQNTSDIKIITTGNLNNRSTGKETMKNINNKFGSLEKPRTSRQCIMEENKFTPKWSTPQGRTSALSISKSRTCFQNMQNQKSVPSSFLENKRERSQEKTLLKEETIIYNTFRQSNLLKVENSQVTVAVRVRPFSSREKTEKASQVVFMNGQETTVQYPDMKQIYNFIYDFSFWSFDKSHSNYASQMTVYETLAVPLLESAFEGYNTCLFAYGQTGSGKSYTMMGFGEEVGIIPRFCKDLFSQVAKKETQEVSYHLEMSFFEIYNEKIHDLLVCKGENGQKKQPLRVREHPVSGPYVEALSVNVVSSYSDIQSWLELGNKQRATAATGMNDKSSRSHSVFTLVMTQTKTEFVEEEEHDHRIISRINLIDLAGSERCSATQTSGERLKEGVSINKSLLTLGKVISALSEQASRKRIFIPYRESVLTWLLKESLGGNSKTAMIATVSPAASNIEETLSTLRYAKQARLIINIAKVNEDVNAKLIRELKAEIEKLKATQRNTRNIDPERYRRCQQEITSLRMKLHQQEKDIVEMQRAWREKLEQAEKRKLQETKELQKAGITFKMDNRLPNLVNLNEDPQLSEMLLYMIKEGKTTVGKNKPNSGHDIQLSGVLIADDHCVIENFDGTVSIIPLGDAKTYVNGKHISESTILHHGDRVILGGDHYFRFNHPVEVQKGKISFCGSVLTNDGPKDFEFAKNELLMAQRSQLEAEIEEARLKAKEEMMQGIQIAKEMAQQELSSQRTAYESKIKALEMELKEESERKKMQEINNQKANDKIQELEKAKQHLEQKVHVNKKRLEMETLATKQALEDHTVRHAKILEALEAEKQKIVKEVQILQQNRNNKDKMLTIQPNWNFMKLSMMIQEANTISNKLRKCYVFCRHDISSKGNSTEPSVQVQVRNVQLGISTFWSLEKFESKLAAMKELYESNSGIKGEDIFYDPVDEWEPDLANTTVSSFSRRRSKSLMKNRRISGCLQDIKVHPIKNLNSSHSSGLMEKSSSIYSNSTESFLPGICKDLIGSALDFLSQSDDEEKTMVDSLITNFLKIHACVISISKAYEQQDEESQDNFFSTDRVIQSFCIQMTSAFEQLVVLTKHWLDDFPQSISRPDDDLTQEVKKLGGYLQLFLQGCCSDISSMVNEAQKKMIQTMLQAVKYVGQLAILKGTKLHLSENSRDEMVYLQEDFINAICDGVSLGMNILLDSGLEKMKQLQQELLGQCPQNKVIEKMKTNAMALIRSFENTITEWKTKDFRAQAKEEESVSQDVKKLINLATEFLKLKHCLEQISQIVISALKGLGSYSDVILLKNCVENICNLVRHINDEFILFTPLSGSTNTYDDGISGVACRELQSLAKSLLLDFESEERFDLLKPKEICKQNSEDEEKHNLTGNKYTSSKGVPKQIHKLQTPSSTHCTGEFSPSNIQWV
ncbi:kinesin-like protein KIF14 [Monodelphis domestica]|uniref:kinesin-like protein KIF14 n=1 Tax=Monodelphis domestica TaxID=13616 RepID=UPI0024E269E3|nr:kinesin-like protein KIF14 [Monodelphis domestica]XP_016285514.2 kinesin-like protein KIF14 [Monodelphis domestica]XP_056671671.1 kinesin-like protein KIF14 [Monodelphis domestica]XP_056671672.1 kinesin-like protein KIF14 [Monodelphis domestica]XP_056671673.1 kinesin-like protein KIF14 [Monodelphis domestica]XP_056671674.1 kinesin-like protein KIF14 [Monodelphis domestica]